MKKLDDIRKSEDMTRLVALTAEAEALKWKVIGQIDKACNVHGNMVEPLEDWEKRVNELEAVVESKEAQAPWNDGSGWTTTNVIGFMQFEVRRAKRTIRRHREAGHKECQEFE
jgi:hypothetical protein